MTGGSVGQSTAEGKSTHDAEGTRDRAGGTLVFAAYFAEDATGHERESAHSANNKCADGAGGAQAGGRKSAHSANATRQGQGRAPLNGG